MIPPSWAWTIGAALANHLWQSTLCVAAAAVVARALKRHAAPIRYRVWLLASVKFLVPFSLLAGIGRSLPVPAFPSAPAPLVSIAVHVIGEPFVADRGDRRARVEASIVGARQIRASQADTGSPAPRVMWLVSAVWVIGSLALGVSRWIRWRRLTIAARASASLHSGREATSLERARARFRSVDHVDLRSSPSFLEPGVIGFIRPMILWPAALTARLTDAELDAVLAHELSHIRRRDNLVAAAHALIETVFWFHPAIWWLETRLVDERERACDEDVLRSGSDPQTYAGSILKVCDFCLQSPMVVGRRRHGIESDRPRGGHHDQGRSTFVERMAENTAGDRRTHPCGGTGRTWSGRPAGGGAVRRECGAACAVVPGRTEPPAVAEPMARGEPAAEVEPAVQTAGRVSGVVTDQSGGLLVGATVTITAAQRTAVTDVSGRYTMANLTPGQYEMTVQLTGFRVSKTPVRIDAGIEVTHDVRLGIGAVSESLNVTGPETPVRQINYDAIVRAQNYLDQARRYADEGRQAEADGMFTRALNLMRAEAAAAATAALGNPPPLPPPSAGAVRVGGDITAPKKIRDVKPTYPPDALAAGLEGLVILEATIATDGTVKDVRVLRSVPAFDEAAAAAVRQWKFMPTTLNGNPVDVLMTVTVNFTR